MTVAIVFSLNAGTHMLNAFCMQDPTFSERKFSFSMAKSYHHPVNEG